MKAISRSLRITPKKLNLIAEMVREKNVPDALEILSLTPKKGAKLLHKAVKSAAANATNNFKQEEEGLFVKEIVVNKAQTMKRFLPASRGRSMPILKRNSHVTVILGINENKPAKKQAKGEEAKTEEKPAAKKKSVKKAPAASPSSETKKVTKKSTS